MSEIAKCPLCGNVQIEVLNEHNVPDGGYCCGVRCASIKKWNQYAAAMELAKLTVQMKTCRAYCPERAFLYAQDRVLEVFNGGTNEDTMPRV